MPTESPQPRLQIILIHGTRAKAAPWTRHGSPLREIISEQVDGVEFHTLDWSARNRQEDRAAASLSLGLLLEKLDGHPTAIIAHSHGGNIACRALIDAKIAHRPLLTVFLATPFLQVAPRLDSLEQLGTVVDSVDDAESAEVLVWWATFVAGVTSIAMFGFPGLWFAAPVVAAVVALVLLLRRTYPRAISSRTHKEAERLSAEVHDPALFVIAPVDEAVLWLRTVSFPARLTHAWHWLTRHVDWVVGAAACSAVIAFAIVIWPAEEAWQHSLFAVATLITAVKFLIGTRSLVLFLGWIPMYLVHWIVGAVRVIGLGLTTPWTIAPFLNIRVRLRPRVHGDDDDRCVVYSRPRAWWKLWRLRHCTVYRDEYVLPILANHLRRAADDHAAAHRPPPA